MSPETNVPELLSEDRPIETADTEPPPASLPTEPAPRVTVEIQTTLDGADRLMAAFARGELAHLGILAVEPSPSLQIARAVAVVTAMCADPMREVRSVLAHAANAAARLSRRPGAPVLDVDSPRGTLIAWLKWNDGNGDFDDPVVWHEGPEGLLDEGWWVSAPEGHRQWFGTGPEAESKARAHAASLTVSIDELWESLAGMDLEDVAGVSS